MSYDEFVEKGNIIHVNKYDYTKVNIISYKTKVCIICPIHGEFEQTIGNHLSGKGCPKCGRVATIQSHKKDINHFLKKAKEIHGDKYDYTKVVYKGCREKVCIVCPKHGEFWQTPSNHYKFGCKDCGFEIKTSKSIKSFNDYEEIIYNIHGDIYEYDKTIYVNYHTPMKILCKKCGNYFFQSLSKHITSKHGCPICKQSHLENAVENRLKELDIEFIRQYTNDKFKGLKLDFYIPKQQIAIECQGTQHFQKHTFFHKSEKDFLKQIDRDIKKSNICEENSIKLIYVINDDIEINNLIPKIYNENNIVQIESFLKEWK